MDNTNQSISHNGILFNNKKEKYLSMVEHTCNPSTWKVSIGGSRV
jgi:hypothetical protein